jgi:oxygen-independent coproporphyrinogen III oxidase
MLAAIARRLGRGYVYVGMDHFALPDDALAVAKRQGRLHRNFQGYSTQPDCDLIALGVSAIGRIGATYSQNAKTLDEYYDALRPGPLPIVRGLALTRDDLLRRSVIMASCARGQLQYESIELGHLIDFKSYFRPRTGACWGTWQTGTGHHRRHGIDVTPTGWYLVRAIAMVFDKNLQVDWTGPASRKSSERFVHRLMTAGQTLPIAGCC